MYKFEVEFTEEEIQKFLSYGDKFLKDLTNQRIENILSSMATGTRERMIDEPHYVYEELYRMIYKTYKEEPFDDRFMRIADSAFDVLYERKMNKDFEAIKSSLPLPSFAKEYHEVLLSFPRQTGKTTYTKKLANKLNYMGNNVLLVVNNSSIRSLSFNEEYRHTDISVMTKDSFRTLEEQLCAKTLKPYDVVLFDEIRSSDIQWIMDKLTGISAVMHRIVDYDTIYFGLSTDY